MVPNKFEEHIKSQLLNRKIQPSEDAWERLSEKLDATSQNGKKRGYFWYGLAAGFIGLLLVSTVYFNSRNNDGVTEVQTVDIVDDTKNSIKIPTIEKENNYKAIAVRKNEKTEKPIPVDYRDESVASINKSEDVLNDSVSELIVIDDERIAFQNKKEAKAIISKEIIDVKINEVLLEINTNTYDVAISDREIDSLLRVAQQQLLQKGGMYTDFNPITAETLLAAVESELDKSFRDQVFDALKKSFIKARTAVADRNK